MGKTNHVEECESPSRDKRRADSHQRIPGQKTVNYTRTKTKIIYKINSISPVILMLHERVHTLFLY